MKPYTLKFKGLILKEKHGYSSLCLDLDVASQGSTPAQAKRMLREAVALYLETCVESNLPYLRPVPLSENPELSDPSSVLESFDLEVGIHVVANAA
jgi:predicted RNase H-like HicB family nuclease